MSASNDRSAAVPLGCLITYLAVFGALAISPSSREVWLLESALSLTALGILLRTYRRFRFSDRAYVQGTVFVLLHTIGAFYVYTDVPLGDWARQAFGFSRNHYDRLVHLAFGALIFLPTREVFFRGRERLSLRLELFLTFALICTWSLGYELFEWRAAVLADLDPQGALVGNQGDPWDSQTDMGLACLGAAAAIAVELVLAQQRAGRPVRDPGGGARAFATSRPASAVTRGS